VDREKRAEYSQGTLNLDFGQDPTSPAPAPKLERPDLPPNVLAGTSAFTAAGWQGTFYPNDLPQRDYLRHYATKFNTVEVDSTYYRTPTPATVKSWYDKTPSDFIFAAKVPQTVTHQKILVDCHPEIDEFLQAMSQLREKLGPLLLQFPYFGSEVFANAAEFLARLDAFLRRTQNTGVRFAVEIRNKNWLDVPFADLLRQHKVALALTDRGWMPRPHELAKKFDPITTDFTYVRWLGDRKGIEKITTTWDKTIVDRGADLQEWVKYCTQVVRRGVRIYAYANNHYAGHGPATVKMFSDLWPK
jgi:uncharacterized protein YecE (DUF72 family)